MQDYPSLFVMGDIHGYFDVLVRQLRYAGLATSDARWTGGKSQLWFMGDFTDRGPDGVGVIDFVMRLQADAARQGGQVGALLGNHDVALLTARLFPHAPTDGPGGAFYADWREYGGTVSDIERLENKHIDWLRRLPAMALVGDRLLMHADAPYYLYYGETLEAVNTAISDLMHSGETDGWNELLGFSGERYAFDDRKPGGVMLAAQMLAIFGGKQIIHGHTPIPLLSGAPLERVTRAFIYAEGLAADVDGWICKGGAGFVYQALPIESNTLAPADARL